MKQREAPAMNYETFLENLHAVRARAGRFRRDADGPQPVEMTLTAVLQELDVALEELRVTEEEVRLPELLETAGLALRLRPWGGGTVAVASSVGVGRDHVGGVRELRWLLREPAQQPPQMPQQRPAAPPDQTEATPPELAEVAREVIAQRRPS